MHLQPLTLTNPRHESFALNLAAGALPEDAYTDAGFSAKNRKARAHDLAETPEIKTRAAYLRSCLPRLYNLKQRFAPSHLLMPQSKDDMMTWLWQIASGARKIPPLQLRAATLLIRLKGWHISRPADPLLEPPPETLTRQEQHLLATFNQLTVESDTAGLPVPEIESRRLYSALADAELTGLESNVPLSLNPLQTMAYHGQQPQTSPNEAPNSPSIPLEPQLLNPSKSPKGDENTPRQLSDLSSLALATEEAKDEPNGDIKQQQQPPAPTPPSSQPPQMHHPKPHGEGRTTTNFPSPCLPSGSRKPLPTTANHCQPPQTSPSPPLRDLDSLLESRHLHLRAPGDSAPPTSSPPSQGALTHLNTNDLMRRISTFKRQREHLSFLHSQLPASPSAPLAQPESLKVSKSPPALIAP